MNRNVPRHQLMIKRGIDLTVAALALAVLLPLLVLILTAIRISMGKPAIYKQTRPGKDEKLFRLWKFRTMTYERDAQGKLLPDIERLTRVGLFLRKTSLDELPQLINVLKGDMSLVGPRPLLVRYLGRYSARQHLRHSVKPGLTGWAQVNWAEWAQIDGREVSAWDARMEMDVWYAEHWSLWLDWKVLWLTAAALLSWNAVKAGKGEELDEFWGNEGIPVEGPQAVPVEEDESWAMKGGHGGI